MKNTIIVSNRLPIEVKIEDDELNMTPSVGGLTTGLSSIHPKKHSLWIGWPGISEDDIPNDEMKAEMLRQMKEMQCVPVMLNDEEIEDYYYGFSNRIIWPLFHYFTEYSKFTDKQWKSYQTVNEKFASEIFKHSTSSSILWIHDYHLMLLPSLVRKEEPDLNIGFFLHIPFPSYEIFRTLPSRIEILEGLLGSDLIGFHTFDYQNHFLECVTRLLDAEIDCNKIIYQGKTTVVNVYPMGIDAKKFEKEAELQDDEEPEDLVIKTELEEYIERSPDIKFIISIDRMDYTKGIINRINGFEYFLDHNPEYKEKVKLIMLAVPSRTQVPQYQKLKKEIDETVGRINAKFATMGWTPILYMYRSFPFEKLVELYAASHVALITPVRDGMNLVAKEYIMSRSQKDGVLILSEMTGAAKELPEALIINPNSFQEISKALKEAINMPLEEQTNKMTLMQNRVRKYDVAKWTNEFMSDLEKTKKNNQNQLISAWDTANSVAKKYEKAKKRLILLDYDGTLIGFENEPQKAVPDEKLLSLLKRLSDDPKNLVYIISGRDHHSLEKWFSNTQVNLIAEHGAISKTKNKNWASLPGLDASWKEKTKPFLEKFVLHTPGSFIEEKDYSIAWHYRKSDEALGENKAEELLKILHNWSANLNIRILNSNKVIEITDVIVNKGNAVKSILQDYNADFILAIGDDHTDEFMFEKLPNKSISIKVGRVDTQADFYLENFEDVRNYLHNLLEKGNTDLRKSDKMVDIL